MYTINADLVTGVNGICYLKGQIVSGDVFIPGAIDSLVASGAISLQVIPKTSKSDQTV
jgi:hypothetical protein